MLLSWALDIVLVLWGKSKDSAFHFQKFSIFGWFFFFNFFKHGHLSSHCAYKLPLMSHSGTRLRVYIHNLGRMLSVTAKTEPRQSGSLAHCGSTLAQRSQQGYGFSPQFCLYCPSVFFIPRFVLPRFLQFSWWSQIKDSLFIHILRRKVYLALPGHPLLSLPWFLWAAFCI